MMDIQFNLKTLEEKIIEDSSENGQGKDDRPRNKSSEQKKNTFLNDLNIK